MFLYFKHLIIHCLLIFIQLFHFLLNILLLFLLIIHLNYLLQNYYYHYYINLNHLFLLLVHSHSLIIILKMMKRKIHKMLLLRFILLILLHLLMVYNLPHLNLIILSTSLRLFIKLILILTIDIKSLSF